MPLPTIVIAQNDPAISLGLANDLHAHFARVAVADDILELRVLLQRHEARVAVLDLELISVDDVRQLTHIFRDLTVICTHRSPDEKMWMAALSAGAVEFCHPHDLRSILRATRNSTKNRLAVAA